MTSIPRPRPDRHIGRLVWGTLAGAGLVAIGLGLAYLVIETPLVDRLLAGNPGGSGLATSSVVVWSLALAAGGGLLVAGTNRLAGTVASVRGRRTGRSPLTRMDRTLTPDILVAAAVIPHDGRPIPELAIGPFGVAVVHELTGRDRLRRNGQGWEMRTHDGWVPAESPLDAVARDADRVRHWLTTSDLDYVVRVYAALVTTDDTIQRTPTCAVIREAQIPAWLGALPRQRSFSEGRRNHLLSRLQGTAGASRRH
jgi:hypothetical protein